jgi:hypothetical protein
MSTIPGVKIIREPYEPQLSSAQHDCFSQNVFIPQSGKDDFARTM